MRVFCCSISSVFQIQHSKIFSFFYNKEFNLCWNDCMQGKIWQSYKSHKISQFTVLLDAALKSQFIASMTSTLYFPLFRVQYPYLLLCQITSILSYKGSLWRWG